MKWVLGKLKLDKINLKPSELRENLGSGEPVTMGLLIGFAVSMIAKWQFLGDVASWATILNSNYHRCCNGYLSFRVRLVC